MAGLGAVWLGSGGAQAPRHSGSHLFLTQPEYPHLLLLPSALFFAPRPSRSSIPSLRLFTSSLSLFLPISIASWSITSPSLLFRSLVVRSALCVAYLPSVAVVLSPSRL